VSLREQLLSLLVPPLCAVCREPELDGAALCTICRARLVALHDPRCGRCGAPVAQRSTRCRECRARGLAFHRAWSAFAYQGVARDVVGALKMRGLVVLAELAAAEIAVRAPKDLLAGELVPVPAHPRRRRRHGFNQSGSIAGALGRIASLPVRDVLRRARVPAQVGLERRARLQNARESVLVRSGVLVPPFALLVDDVYTTGATLDACAHVLRQAGAREVAAVTFARAVRG
jgi:ComF family protein